MHIGSVRRILHRRHHRDVRRHRRGCIPRNDTDTIATAQAADRDPGHDALIMTPIRRLHVRPETTAIFIFSTTNYDQDTLCLEEVRGAHRHNCSWAIPSSGV